MGFSLPFIKPFAMTDDNELAAGYQLFFYEVGTPDQKPTYKDFALTIPNTNPIILDATGRFECFLAGGPYKAILKTPVAMGSATVWEVPKFSGTGSDQLLVVLNIADLKLLIPNTAEQVMVLGYYTPGDKGGGIVLWNSGTALSDDGIYFKPASILIGNPGRWVRDFTGAINLLWYGARGDNLSFDDIPLESAIDYALTIAPTGQTIEITPSSEMLAYRFSAAIAGLDGQGFTLNVLEGATLNFDLAQVIGCTFNAGPYRIFVDASAAVTFNTKARLIQGAYAEWWGAVGDGVVDCEIALGKLFACTAYTYVLPNFFYLVVGVVVPPTTGTIYAYGKIQTAALAVQLEVGIHLLNVDGIIRAEYIRGEVKTSGLLVESDTDVIAGRNLQAQVGSGGLNFRAGGLVAYSGPLAVGAAEISLVSLSIPVNSLLNNGDKLEFDVCGKVNNNANLKRFRLYFGPSLVSDTGAAFSPNNLDWVIRGFILRTSVTEWISSWNISFGEDGLGVNIWAEQTNSNGGNLGIGNDFTNFITLMRITGQGIGLSDISSYGGTFKFLPAPI